MIAKLKRREFILLLGGCVAARSARSDSTAVLQLRALNSDHPEDGPPFDQVAL